MENKKITLLEITTDKDFLTNGVINIKINKAITENKAQKVTIDILINQLMEVITKNLTNNLCNNEVIEKIVNDTIGEFMKGFKS